MIFQDGKHKQEGPQILKLRTEFLHTLCIADELGVLSSIQHIAKDMHSKDAHAFKMPYVSMPKSFPLKAGVSKTATCNDPPVLQDETVLAVESDRTGTVHVDSESLADTTAEDRVQGATCDTTASMSQEPTIGSTACSLNLQAPQVGNAQVTTDLTTDSENLQSSVQALALSPSEPDTSTSQEPITCTCSANIDPPVAIDHISVSKNIAVTESSVHVTALPDSAPETTCESSVHVTALPDSAPETTCSTYSSQESNKSAFRDEVEHTVTSQIGSCTLTAAKASDSSHSAPIEEMPRRRVKQAQKRGHTGQSRKKAGTKHSNGDPHKGTNDGPKVKKMVLYYGMGAGTFKYTA